MDSEIIYKALFDLLKLKVSGLKTISRRLKHFNHVSSDDRPAMFITQGNQQEQAIKGLNAKVELEAEVYVYVHEADPELPPSTQLNAYIDQVRQALKPEFPEMCEYQTLNGIVEHCWIDGTIEVFEAVENMLDSQAIAIIPVRILTTN